MSNLQRQRCAIVALVWLIGGSVAGAQLEGGTFTAVNPDPQPRFFHAGSVLNDGLVMISGETRSRSTTRPTVRSPTSSSPPAEAVRRRRHC